MRNCFLGLCLLKAYTRRVAEFDGKNYPKFKSVFIVFFFIYCASYKFQYPHATISRPSCTSLYGPCRAFLVNHLISCRIRHLPSVLFLRRAVLAVVLGITHRLDRRTRKVLHIEIRIAVHRRTVLLQFGNDSCAFLFRRLHP